MNKKSLARIFPIKLFEDNYSYLVCSPYSNNCCLIDPADPNTVLSFLTNFKNLIINHVLYTHKHWDHAGGAKNLQNQLAKHYPNTKTFFVANKHDAESIEHINIQLDVDSNFKSGDFVVSHFHVPCHTKGHTLYKFELAEFNSNTDLSYPADVKLAFESDKFLFTGDTLFIGGCGRFFEGNADQMLRNMDLISGLGDNINIFPGHEYTLKNLEWALTIDKNNQCIKDMIEQLEAMEDVISIPSTIKQEKVINVFMRCRDKIIQELIGEADAVKVMDKLRELKNSNKGI